MHDVVVRLAQKDEIKTLQNLNDEVFIDNFKYDSDLKTAWAQSDNGGKKYFTDLLNDEDSICLVAEVDNKVTGYIAASSKEISYRNSKYIEIENMGVIPEYRSLGIGRLLMNKCLGLAKEKGYQKAYVNSYSRNLKAIEFYKRNGFDEIDISLERTL
jgi:ribosomal protein S18 acetylase RimI-like enzyme